MSSIQTGRYSLSSKGKFLKGRVVRFLPREKKVTFLTETHRFIRKWEKYELHTKKIHARVPDQLMAQFAASSKGRMVCAIQRRPVSKTIHYQVVSLA